MTVLTQASTEPLEKKRVAVIGYGNQGQAHALNLRDANIDVTVGGRPGKSWDLAVQDGFHPQVVAKAVKHADLVILTLPDESAGKTYAETIHDHLTERHTLGFVHGFNIRYGFIKPPDHVNVIMVAPKGPGTLLRSLYRQGLGLPALLAVHQDPQGTARTLAQAWAAGIGATRAGVVETTFAAETETDLFGEQAVLCGGMTALTKAAFETLVEAGYAPEFAYLECVHELKQVVDLLYEQGLCAMRDRISNTAEYGDLTRGPRLIDARVKEEMKRILQEIRDGTFAEEWIRECRNGGRKFQALHDADANTPYERAGEAVRALMPWLAKKANATPTGDSTSR